MVLNNSIRTLDWIRTGLVKLGVMAMEGSFKASGLKPHH